LEKDGLTAVWHIGVMTPCAPESRARLIIYSISHGILIIGLAPDPATALFSYVAFQPDTWAEV